MRALCMEALVVLHKMWHELIDLQTVSAESSIMPLPDTEPETSVVILMVALDSKDAEAIRTIAHDTVREGLELLYGKSKTVRHIKEL